MTPKVSVIVPVYNVADYLGQCLDSILFQTLQDIEVICIDDGSTDDSLNILKTYTNLDDRLKIITQKNQGAAAARNRGLKEATGEFVIFLDSDDFFDAEMLEKMSAQAEKENSDIVVCGWMQFSNDQKTPPQQFSFPTEMIQKSPLKRQDLGNILFIFAANPPWNKLIRLSFLKKQKIEFDELVHQGNDLCFSLCVIGTANLISVMGNPFVCYRLNPRGLTLTASGKNISNKNVSDLCQTLSRAFLYLKGQKLPYDLISTFCVRVKKSLSWRFQNLPKEKVAQFLPLIKIYLHPELYQFLFGGTEAKVSVIIPAYNAAEFLPECLDSCLNQTLKDIEIICVDDGSSDDTLKILNKYAQQDKRIQVIHQENKGLPISRNNALKLATGKYIQFLDADDYLEPTTCECLYLYSQIYDLEMLFFKAIEFQNDTRKEFEELYHCLKWVSDNFIPVFSWQNVKEVIVSVAVTACLTFYKHDFLKQNNIHWIDKKICYEDSPFFIESFLKAKRVGALCHNFYHRRVHKAAITQNMSSNFLDYCEISRLTLKIAKQYADDIAFSRLFYGYVIKSWKNYFNIPSVSQDAFKEPLIEHYQFLSSTYNLPLPKEIEDWINFEQVVSGKACTISDFSILNIKEIFNKKSLSSKTDATLQMLFKQRLDALSQSNFVDYAIIWGSGNWSPQPEIVSFALKNSIPILRLEDGFLRSADTWVHNSIDTKYTSGISFTFSNDVHYFDATRSSFMERLVNDKNLKFNDVQLDRARKCIDFIIKNHLTKYNHQPIYTPSIGRKGVQKVLVVDQSYGDFSISKGLANDETFKIMLERAISENPNADIIIKTHPDAISPGSSRPKGYYSGYQPHDNVYLLTTPINPISLLKYCDKVYVCTSQFGFEALMCGKEVHTFGMPFYAGWGLTIDNLVCSRRKNKRTLEELFYIAYILYTHYVSPITEKECEIEEAMDYLLKLREEYFKKIQIGEKTFS